MNKQMFDSICNAVLHHAFHVDNLLNYFIKVLQGVKFARLRCFIPDYRSVFYFSRYYRKKIIEVE